MLNKGWLSKDGKAGTKGEVESEGTRGEQKQSRRDVKGLRDYIHSNGSMGSKEPAELAGRIMGAVRKSVDRRRRCWEEASLTSRTRNSIWMQVGWQVRQLSWPSVKRTHVCVEPMRAF